MRKSLDALRKEVRHERTNSADTRSFNLCNILSDVISHIEELKESYRENGQDSEREDSGA